MIPEEKRLLKVFLCHASGDKPAVRTLYKELVAEGVDAWLDQEKLLPGQDWRLEIPRAVQEADVVVVCLSGKSITKEGYVQKEIKFALDIAEEKPEGTIFLIPARLEDCAVPERLSRWHWVDLYEENGFAKLLRSLKLRANKVGAVIEPTPYEDVNKEREKRTKQLYTEGLAAFYTEDWDKACHRFQSILSEQPNHRNASEKLAEADRQRNLSKLYEQASEAVRSEDWGNAIRILEELSQKSAEYKDAASLLKRARRQKQLKDLHVEASTLHEAQKWDAVLKVFEQIAAIEPNYPDPNGLLPSAQKEMAELKRLADLDDLYTNAINEMEAGRWIEARQLLEKVHKSQTGFLETERLLRKVENEIGKEEEQTRRAEQVNVLYEQAHGFVRSQKWRKALDKIEEIEKLDTYFEDKDGIAQKAQAELEREEQDAQKQNQLAAKYAEAVRLLKEEKYQQALDKWGEVKVVDSKYPDRQWVGRTARKRLAETAKPVQLKPRFVMSRQLWVGIVGFIVVGVVITGVILSGRGNQGVLPVSTQKPTQTSSVRPVNPTATKAPGKTNTPRPATPVPTASGYSDPTMYDDFDNETYDDSYNKALWDINADTQNFTASQNNGKLSVMAGDKIGVNVFAQKNFRITEPTFFESRLYLDPDTTNSGTHFFIIVGNSDGYSNCGIFRTGDFAQKITCWSQYYGKKAETKLNLDGIQPGWHVLRFEIDPETMIISYVIDGRLVAYFDPKESIPDHFNSFKLSTFNFWLGMNNFGPSKAPVGYIDYVRMGAIEDDPTVYDNFDNSSFNGKFDVSKWTYLDGHHYPDGSVYQENGVLSIQQIGTEEDRWQFLQGTSVKYFPLESAFFESALRVDPDSKGGDIQIGFVGESGHVICGVSGPDSSAYCWCNASGSNHMFEERISAQSNSWHIFRIEIVQPAMDYIFYIDGNHTGSCSLPASVSSRSTWIFKLGVWMQSKNVIGYVDYVHIGILDEIKSKSSLIPTTFSNPLFDGYRLDRCYLNGDQCELPAANAWCKLTGFNKATKYDFDLDVGLTKIIGSSEICNDYCDAFKSITCE